MLLRATLLSALPLVLLSTESWSQVGTPFCMGTQCPCSNDDPNAGCGNSGVDFNGATGSLLFAASGSSNHAADDLVLAAEGITPLRFGVFVAGTTPNSQVLGDGLLCVAGNGADLQRLQPQTASLSGTITETKLIQKLDGTAVGNIQPGTTLHFQVFYRDPGGPCGSGFNLSNALSVTFTAGAIELDLVGEPLVSEPSFDFVNAFNSTEVVSLTLDPQKYPGIANQQTQVFITEGRTRNEWDLDPVLVDVRGGSSPANFAGTDIAGNILSLDPGTLAGPSGTAISHGYDVVVDLDGDGLLSDGDFVDGRGDEHGFAVFRDMVAPGPYSTVEINHDHGSSSFHLQNIFYPSNIAELGELPLIVVSHGNGHNYNWYDHIGDHMSSYGFIVMSHRNNTNPGPNSAATTTIENTDVFLQNLALINGGALVGHVDKHRMIWIGHSRGAEGVARAYKRIVDGADTPTQYVASDIQLVSSIAPTDFLGNNNAPGDVPYQLWVGAADDDVHGAPNSSIAQPYHLLTRATGQRFGVTYHGVGHGGFHNGTGSIVAAGSCTVGRGNTHRLMKGYFLPTVYNMLGEDAIAEEYLWRKWESLRSLGVPTATCPDVVYEYWNGPGPDAFVIDDFQTQTSDGVSSSQGTVAGNVTSLVEGRLQDGTGNLTHNVGDPMNGMTRNGGSDNDRGIVFEWTMPSFLEFEVVAEGRNFADYSYLSFRACQGTRHPLTLSDLEDLTFDVTLRDAYGNTSTLNIGAYKGGITDPFARNGNGTGTGWSNEFETTRIRLADFATNHPDFVLTDVAAIRFEFAGPGASLVGRIGMDDIELVQP
jgi:hypothetical protein